MTLDRDMFNGVVRLITPYAETTQDQQWLVNMAFATVPNVRNGVQYGGAGSTFAVLLVRRCLDYGMVDDKNHAVSLLLDPITDKVNPTQRQRIAEIQSHLNGTPLPSDPIVPAVVLPPANNPREEKYIFISYASIDRRGFVEGYARDLSNEGYAVWVDNVDPEYEGITPGADFRQELANAINRAAFFNVILTPESVKSKWVHAEVRRAKELGITVLPLLLRELRDADAKAAYDAMEIGTIHYVNLAKDGQAAAFQQVLTSLERWGVPKRNNGS